MEETKVIFRKWKDTGDVLALFPRIPASVVHPYLCLSYQHLGQHAAASYPWVIRQTEPVTPEEYADLKAELERVGYENLRVMQRRTPGDREMLLERHRKALNVSP